jgi:hypothetical protein
LQNEFVQGCGGPWLWATPEIEKRIKMALAAAGRPGVRELAKQFGVAPGTVQDHVLRREHTTAASNRWSSLSQIG